MLNWSVGDLAREYSLFAVEIVDLDEPEEPPRFRRADLPALIPFAAMCLFLFLVAREKLLKPGAKT